MKISEILQKVTGKTVKKIETGTECELIGEIAYQLREATGDIVELDIPVEEKINDLYISRMLDMGVIWGDRKPAFYNKAAFYRKENRNFDNLVIKKTVEDWTFNKNDDLFKNSVLDYSNGSGYVPLVAYFMVEKLVTGTKGVLHLTSSTIPDIYSQLFVLMYYGNKLIEGVVELENVSLNQAEWFSYIITQHQYNRMTNSVDSTVKYNWLKENGIEKGDVLLLYTIGKKQNKSRRELISCFIAVVEGYNQYEMMLNVISSVETVLTQVYRVSTSDFKDKTLEDYTRFNMRNQTIQYTSLGVEYYTYDEEYMIMIPTTDDGSVQLMVMPDNNGGWDIQKVEMDTLDTIYAVLKNRGIKFNEKKFIEKHFASRGVTPIYARYIDNQPTEYENSTKAEIIKKYGGQ